MSQRQLPIILALGTTQTLAWASSYYLPALLADPMARDLGVSSNWIFGAFSASLVISAMLGPRIGRQIDLFGGRQVLSVSNLTMAAGLVLLGLSHSLAVMAFAWLVLGIGMAMGLYDAAFAALSRIYGTEARRPITGITLMAGFASTVGWPLTAWGLSHIGWRETCFAWAAANHPDRPAPELLHAAGHQGRQPGRGDGREAAFAARPHHGAARLRVRGGLDRHRRNGRPFPAPAGGHGRDACRGHRRRRADRSRHRWPRAFSKRAF